MKMKNDNSKFKMIFKPTWKKILSSLLSYIIAVFLGFNLYFSSICLTSGNDCVAYSPLKIFLAKILWLPIFVKQKFFYGYTDNVSNLDPIFFGKFGWLVLFLYYYLIVSIIDYFIRQRSNTQSQSKNLQ